MNTETKQHIKNDLAQFVQKIGSQLGASKRMREVSNGTISNILAGKWDNIADAMWLSIQKQVKNSEWMHNDTSLSKFMDFFYTDIMLYSEVRCVISPSDTGKTHSAKRHVSNNTNAFLISCDECMTKRDFLEAILIAMGESSAGKTTRKMLNSIIDHLLRVETPELIFDEFDKVKDEIFLFLISFYNRTEDKAAIIIQGTPYLKQRIEDGVKKGKKGFVEVFTRINSRFVEPPQNKPAELMEIARLNGVADEEELIRITNDSDGSIRRIKSSTKVYLRRPKKLAA
ncbi:ATP-binding protein [Pedobacter sp. PAMC26386]|nr:ATP-binding protein [Pedobacter sp. PAMC26386]